MSLDCYAIQRKYGPMVLSKSQRLKVLLQNGYFPRELPPPFTTKDLATFRKYVKDNWPHAEAPKSTPEIYSNPRLGFKRRPLAIVNPTSQFFLAELISESWVEISKFLATSLASVDKPELRGGIERAIPKPDFARIDLKKLETAAEYDHILYSDISRFYGTIYTHVLPWALYTKPWSKANMNTKAFKNSLGNQLDVRVRKGQDNQTIGIPIGPDTSRILAEIVAVAIERRFSELTKINMDSVFRFVDDWFIGFNTSTQSEEAISHLSRACTEFELELNIEKTNIADPRSHSFALWPEELHQISKIGRSRNVEARDIRHFFSKTFDLAEKNPADNVLEYALKTARSFRVSNANFVLFESFVLKGVRASKITLPVVCQILINYHRKGAPVNLSRIKKLITDLIRQSAPHGHNAEVAWALFLARELEIKLEAACLGDVVSLESSVCALLTLDLRDRGLIVGALDTQYWEMLLTTTSLRDNNWLLAYEADIKGWLPRKHFPGHVEADPWFNVLKKKNISFYDVKRSVPTFEASSRLNLELLRRRTGFARSLFGSTYFVPRYFG